MAIAPFGFGDEHMIKVNADHIRPISVDELNSVDDRPEIPTDVPIECWEEPNGEVFFSIGTAHAIARDGSVGVRLTADDADRLVEALANRQLLAARV